MPKKQLHPTPVPTWLLNANASTTFNPTDVLQGSIYYPGCYVGGHPLQAYGGFSHSFVYPPSLDEPLDEMMKRTQHGADPKGGDDR